MPNWPRGWCGERLRGALVDAIADAAAATADADAGISPTAAAGIPLRIVSASLTYVGLSYLHARTVTVATP